MSDKEFYNLTVSINKALNTTEGPAKMKHVRSIIINTHRTREAKSFWSIVSKQPLMENRFTAWKFCHLLHKILREGHESCIRYSQPHKKMILEMGKLWGHLQDGLGHCIQSYSKLLVTKLGFHEKNSLFPGNLLIEFEQIENFAGEDINLYFQLCVELFDYIEDIIDVQSKVFTSINSYRMSSMTPQGQCRLGPLITLIQDSNPLYDLSVRIMFKLHKHLKDDTLTGHRDRFGDIFHKLKLFYGAIRPLQYFADLIQAPHLPETIPNFASKVDLSSYIPPVVVVQAEPECNFFTDNMICSNDSQQYNQQTSNNNLSDKILAYENCLKEKDNIIRQLQSEICAQREKLNSAQTTYNQELLTFGKEISLLNTKLVDERKLGLNMRVLKNELELQLQATPTLLQKVSEEEGKAKSFEQKFIKLKNMYTQIRDEHIQLLRHHGETIKHFDKMKSENYDLTEENKRLNLQIEECQAAVLSNKELFTHQKLDLEVKMKEVCGEYDLLSKRFEDLQHLHDILDTETAEYKSKLDILENRISEYNERENKRQAEQKILVSALEKNIILKTNEMKILHNNDIESKNSEINEMRKKLCQVNAMLKEKDVTIKQITEGNSMENEIQGLVQKISAYELEIKKLNEETKCLSATVNDTKVKYKNLIYSIIKVIVQSTDFASFKLLNGSELQQHNFFKIYEDLKNILDELNIAYKVFIANRDDVEALISKIILAGYQFSNLKYNCTTVSCNAASIDKGEAILSNLNLLSEPLVNLSEALDRLSSPEVVELEISKIKQYMENLNALLYNLLQSTQDSTDLQSLVEIELKEMDKAIEEATEKIACMLLSSRSADSGTKLQVNEKILDACTNLMESIRVLIQKSKLLQEEILSMGRRCVSVKEFYKRNSQWSEGLISASKSVAKGANLLVDAADKAVSGESRKNLEIIVAAQEIAAYTAQLVAASRVKAPKESARLEELKKASRNVSHATGAIVATVRDCNQSIEALQDFGFEKLTASQAKTIEMEIHVKILELEQALHIERLRLLTFRRQNYQNTDD